MWQRVCALFLVSSLFIPGIAEAKGSTFTLSEAVEQAIKANPSIESKILMLEQARLNVGTAQSYFWPRVSFVATRNRVKNDEETSEFSSDDLSTKTRLTGWRLSWSLFAGFAHLTNLQKSLVSVDMAEAHAKQARMELACNVQLGFLSLLKSRETLKSSEDAVRRLETQLKSAENFVRVGMAPYLNVLQNQTDLAKANQQVIHMHNEIRNIETQLNAYLGFPPEAKVQYVGNLTDFGEPPFNLCSEEEAISMAVRQRPDLMVARKSVEISWKDVRGNAGQFLPRVDATYDKLRSHKEYDDSHYPTYSRHYWAAGLSFSWDVFNGGNTIFSTLAERKHAQALQKDYENSMSLARADVIRSMLDINAATDLVATSRVGLVAARESYNMANKRYMTGTGTIVELLDAQQRLTQAETDTYQALMEYHAARSRFYYATGQENHNLL